MSYRRDNRSVKQFKKDIAEGTATEAEIIRMYIEYFEEKYGLYVDVQNNGCDNSGKYLREDQINAGADFKLNGRLVEVKFNNEKLDYFHFKQSQLESYLKQGAVVLWVNGWDTKRPRFTVLRKKHLLDIKRRGKLVTFDGWGGKKCYRLYTEDYNWYSF